MRLIAAWNEHQADADVVLADNRRGRRCWVLVSMGALSSLPNDQRD
jgi:hypothetical protein